MQTPEQQPERPALALPGPLDTAFYIKTIDKALTNAPIRGGAPPVLMSDLATKVLAKAGETVSHGDGLIVLEENPDG